MLPGGGQDSAEKKAVISSKTGKLMAYAASSARIKSSAAGSDTGGADRGRG